MSSDVARLAREQDDDGVKEMVWRAYKSVKGNLGALGVDNQSIAEFGMTMVIMSSGPAVQRRDRHSGEAPDRATRDGCAKQATLAQ